MKVTWEVGHKPCHEPALEDGEPRSGAGLRSKKHRDPGKFQPSCGRASNWSPSGPKAATSSGTHRVPSARGEAQHHRRHDTPWFSETVSRAPAPCVEARGACERRRRARSNTSTFETTPSAKSLFSLIHHNSPMKRIPIFFASATVRVRATLSGPSRRKIQRASRPSAAILNKLFVSMELGTKNAR